MSKFQSLSSLPLLPDQIISSPLLIMIDVAVSVTVHCKFVKLANPAKLLANCDSSKTYAGRQMTPERVGILIVPLSIEVMI